MDPVLECRALGRRHPNGEDWLLREVSLRVHPGECLAVVGPSGSGKTLLLRSIALVDPTDAGAVLWRGSPIPAAMVPTFRGRVVYLHQRPALFDGSVEDNLRQPYLLKSHAGRHFDRGATIEWLSSAGRPPEFLTQPAGALSGGEAQLVGLLRAVQLAPAMLLLDEPTASLDEQTRRAAEEIVARWLASDKTRAAIWVSHDQGQVERTSHRTLRIVRGQLE